MAWLYAFSGAGLVSQSGRIERPSANTRRLMFVAFIGICGHARILWLNLLRTMRRSNIRMKSPYCQSKTDPG
jgi:hypothetical protein